MPFRGRGSDVIYGGSHIPEELKLKADSVLDQFEENIEQIASDRHLKRAVVRSRLPCLTYVFVNSTDMFVAAAATDAITSTVYLPALDGSFTVEDIQREGILEYGLKNPFAFRFPRRLLELDASDESREQIILHIASQFVDYEVRRMMDEMQLIKINPIFGTSAYKIQERLCFVIMPFAEGLTDVYTSTVKPTVESLDLVCRRADDIPGNGPIMNDIWKSICEARFLIADLTGRNANVFYELGIAHTVGKEAILIRQQEEARIPADIGHIRHIRYEDTAKGARELEKALSRHIQEILDPNVTID